MAMTPAATVAAQICGDLGLTGTPAASVSLANFTAIVTRIQAMLATASVSVDIIAQPVVTTDVVPALGLISAAPGSPVTGVAAGNGVGACTGVAARAAGCIS
jgi:hypothetical protein